MTGAVAPAHPLYLRRLLRRGLLLWLLARMAVTALGAAADVPFLVPGPRTLLLLIALVAMLAHVDARVMRETVLHENLGTPPWLPAAVAAGSAFTIELLIRAVAAFA
jgi:hypothetical protein